MKTIILLFLMEVVALAQTNQVLFDTIIGSNGTVLMTNAEFRCISGNKIFFLNAEGYRSFHANELNTNVLSALHVSESELDKKQAVLDAQNAKMKAAESEAAKKYAEQEKIHQQQFAAKTKARQEALKRGPQSIYTGLYRNGVGTPSFSNPDNASRTGWDNKHYHDNQSMGNFIGN